MLYPFGQKLVDAVVNAYDNLIVLCRPGKASLRRREYNWVDMAKAIDIVSRIAPIWDFSDTGHFLDRPELWDDPSHFKLVVADMMLRRIFGETVPDGWKSFGRYIGRAPAS